VNHELWDAYLAAFWLRPETALILYAEAMAIRSLHLDPQGPWLDLGCGDGIHAALYSGWRFDPEFDAFSCLDLGAADIYNRFDPAEFSARVQRSGRQIEYGIDIKPTAVARAKALGVFENIRQADATALPLADESVGVIFSNMLRDLGEPLGAALGECRRVLREDGVLLLSAMTPAYARHLYFAPAARLAEKAGDAVSAAELLRLDRGRSVFCQRQLSIEQWRDLLKGAGLRLASTRSIVGPAIIRFWDVGLRPFAHALLAQRQVWLDAGVLGVVKRSLLSGMNYMLTPLLESLTRDTACMQLLEVRKE
jgi:SAM-dependent methyltransferase